MDGSIPVDTGFNTTARVKKHDLASEDSSLGVNITSIDMINERFIRTFRLGLVEMLRTSPKVNPNQVEIVRFGDYLKSLKAPLSVNVVRMNPLRGNSIVVIVLIGFMLFDFATNGSDCFAFFGVGGRNTAFTLRWGITMVVKRLKGTDFSIRRVRMYLQ